MARRSRLYFPGVPQHIIQRANDRQACFYAPVDYTIYLDKLHEYSAKYEVKVHAFVLMTNHVHLLATPENKYGISRMIQPVGRYDVRYIICEYGRTGTLWEGRFKSTLVDSERYYLTVSRYIELNPVRAGMVDHPSDYPWSSYHANADVRPIKVITPHMIYRSLGKTSAERAKAYHELFRGHISDDVLNDIRDSTNKGWVLGEGRFKEQVERVLGRAVGPGGHGGDRRSGSFQRKKGESMTLTPLFIGAFRRALKVSGIELPKGQASHVLRHSFALKVIS